MITTQHFFPFYFDGSSDELPSNIIKMKKKLHLNLVDVVVVWFQLFLSVIMVRFILFHFVTYFTWNLEYSDFLNTLASFDSVNFHFKIFHIRIFPNYFFSCCFFSLVRLLTLYSYMSYSFECYLLLSQYIRFCQLRTCVCLFVASTIQSQFSIVLIYVYIFVEFVTLRSRKRSFSLYMFTLRYTTIDSNFSLAIYTCLFSH